MTDLKLVEEIIIKNCLFEKYDSTLTRDLQRELDMASTNFRIISSSYLVQERTLEIIGLDDLNTRWKITVSQSGVNFKDLLA